MGLSKKTKLIVSLALTISLTSVYMNPLISYSIIPFPKLNITYSIYKKKTEFSALLY